ncbi:hypothetical protein C2L65_31615 [Paraburkholderia terrae]|uniref:Uncharacterized protein n=1 Tax=Paraburkholderia terrae TaxID=311230 RepID=A0A2I8EXP4_9BURK|nr:hypothetical protein C2L65_31615 [Paraburkholderia terrae]
MGLEHCGDCARPESTSAAKVAGIRLGQIDRRGDLYLRTLLAQDARRTFKSALRADPAHTSATTDISEQNRDLALRLPATRRSSSMGPVRPPIHQTLRETSGHEASFVRTVGEAFRRRFHSGTGLRFAMVKCSPVIPEFRSATTRRPSVADGVSGYGPPLLLRS